MGPVKGTDVAHFRRRLYELFHQLYGEHARQCVNRLLMILGRYGVDDMHSEPESAWSERDAVLITYPDMVRKQGCRPLEALRQFLKEYVAGVLNTVHILPFFPFSSDDGFSVIDYRAVDPAHGCWEDIRAIGEEFHLMVDLILNHASRKSIWVHDYIHGVLPALCYFIEVDPETDLSDVVRPRSTPLLTQIQTHTGAKHLWATFSDDQLDLNFANPDVFFEFLEILLFYLSNGARIIRLDAIAYLWKTLGTSCIHLPETHAVVKLYRAILETIAPDVLIITETNVPHRENLSYLGDGDEAHVVYQFALPPLLLHTLLTGNARTLSAWAATVSTVRTGCTFLNFTASHDGIGVRPLEGIVSDEEISELADQVQKRGGHVSRKRNSDGTESPYELNISYFDALGNPEEAADTQTIERFLCSQAIMLGLKGIPAVYLHSLVGTRNDREGVERLGYPRAINRKKWDLDELEACLGDRRSPQSIVLKRYQNLLAVRMQHPAFHPDGEQRVLDLGKEVFAILRTSPDGSENVLSLSNVTNGSVDVSMPDGNAPNENPTEIIDLIRNTSVEVRGGKLPLMPYQTCWLANYGVAPRE